jgi:hypothetical protein
VRLFWFHDLLGNYFDLRAH